MPNNQQDIRFKSGDVTLEGVLHLPDGDGKFPGVVICHPHPRYGGGMGNNVVLALAHSICESGIAVLRFNFQGVGESEGTFGQGPAELGNAVDAVDYLALHERTKTTRVGIAGYSFGAWVALEASAESNAIQAVASIACPLRAYTSMGVDELLQPKLLVCGEFDHDFPVEHFKFLSRRFMEPKQVEVKYGADHFFAGYEEDLGEMTAKFFSQWLGDR